MMASKKYSYANPPHCLPLFPFLFLQTPHNNTKKISKTEEKKAAEWGRE